MGHLFCVGGLDDVVVLGIPYKWLLAAAACVILFSIYRIWDEKRASNSK
jgi:hypothetical protein